MTVSAMEVQWKCNKQSPCKFSGRGRAFWVYFVSIYFCSKNNVYSVNTFLGEIGNKGFPPSITMPPDALCLYITPVFYIIGRMSKSLSASIFYHVRVVVLIDKLMVV